MPKMKEPEPMGLSPEDEADMTKKENPAAIETSDDIRSEIDALNKKLAAAEAVEDDDEECDGEDAQDQSGRIVRQRPRQNPPVEEQDLQRDPGNVCQID